MNPERLWAKKPYQGVAPTVRQHCGDVHTTIEAIFDSVRTELAQALDVELTVVDQLLPLARAAAVLHDIGKVNSSFQEMLHALPSSTKRQPVRHEVLGAWLLVDTDFFGSWFGSLRTEEEIWPIIWAIAGHHLKMTDPVNGRPLFNTGSRTNFVKIPMASSEFRDLLSHAARELGSQAIGSLISDMPSLPGICFETTDEDEDSLEQRIHRFTERSCSTWSRLRRNPEVVRRTALLKVLLISADVAGSALTRKDESPSVWVPRMLDIRLRATDLQSAIDRGTRGQATLEFQNAVGAAGPRAIVIAGCGNGKTTAAYLWAQKHAVGRKLWFTYPTTGTASAGYQGYLYDHPDLKSILMHGRAEVDLQAIRGNDAADEADEWIRLESLRAWGQQAIACTVDTVLGLLQNHRRPLFSYPAIATGAFVFDEIHSYDARLFGTLLRFLKTFPGAPVLLMSASIPPTRLAALHSALGTNREQVIRGDQQLEGYERYCLESQDSAEACRREVASALREGKKVLWVCNTVRDCVDQSRQARKWAGVPYDQIIVYHSRFRYHDRVDRQQEVLAEFAYQKNSFQKGERSRTGCSLIFATQVCEMSLDICADLLVTPECPLASLIQRLGRLNRFATSHDSWPCLVYPFAGDPYNERPEYIQRQGDFRVGMAATRMAVTELNGLPCSQLDLAKRLEQMSDHEKFETYSAWLDDGWITEPGTLRDGDSGLTLIREEDLDEINSDLESRLGPRKNWTAASLVPWTIPMLCRKRFEPVDRIAGYPVAGRGTVLYNKQEGATWA